MINPIKTNSWIVYSKHNPQASLRLFCFPYAGGGASIFRTWQENLPATIEVCPIELPGRGTRMGYSLFTKLSPLLQALTEALLPYLDKPFAFFGHSFGALLCFELAHLLYKDYDLEPVHLLVSGRQAPQIPDRAPLHALNELMLMAELHRLNGTPKAVLDNPEMMQLLMPILRADLAIDETYAYASKTPLKCPITVFGGLQDPETNLDDLEAWRQHTSNCFSLHMLPGDRFFINTAQLFLLQVISRELQLIV